MERKHNSDLTTNARTLRKNMTKEGRHLWYDFLKSYPVRFLRQKVIDNYKMLEETWEELSAAANGWLIGRIGRLLENKFFFEDALPLKNKVN